MAKRHKVACDCPRCLGVATADPRYGYDRAAVPLVCCLICKLPIGQEPFVEERGLARFGQMLFIHARCASQDGKR